MNVAAYFGPIFGAVTIARQAWGVRVDRDPGDYLRVCLWRQGPDMRPFRCGDNGRPEKVRVGARRLSLQYDRERRQIVRARDATKTFDPKQLDRVAAVVSELLLFGSQP